MASNSLPYTSGSGCLCSETYEVKCPPAYPGYIRRHDYGHQKTAMSRAIRTPSNLLHEFHILEGIRARSSSQWSFLISPKSSGLSAYPEVHFGPSSYVYSPAPEPASTRERLDGPAVTEQEKA
ncbi:MAG: hypothetical protein Q9207_003623 [Kuettlingeria erythrocarpa]